MQAAQKIGRRYWIPLVLFVAGPAWAGPPSDSLLPKSTKGYISVAEPKQFQERWDKTQLGQMVNDEIMQPFVEDFKKQMRDEFGATPRKLGITLDDIKGVTGGELSYSIIERKEPEAILAITMDVTGHEKEADGMLAAVEKRFATRNGKKTTAKVGDTTLQVFTVPTDQRGKPQVTVYFIKDNILVGVDDRAEAEAMLKRFDGNAKDNLKSLPAYIATMNRCEREAGSLAPEARWFIDPFGLVFAARSLRSEPHRGQDFAKILYDNGFDAIQGAGGYVNQLVDGHVEYLIRSSIYAPPVKGKEEDPLRWNLSMRMLQLPNGAPTEPQSWVPRMMASYTTANMNLLDAFDNVGPVFDAIQEHEDAWKNTLEGWTSDPYGPQVDVRKDFVGNLANRITVMTAYDVPITENSERSVFAIEAKNEQELAKTLDKWMSHEKDMTRREVGPYVIWERTSIKPAAEEQPIEIPGFKTSKGRNKPAAPKREREQVIPSSAVTVALGHLMLASDTKYLTDLLEGFAQRERLASSADYQQVTEMLNTLAPGERSAWAFGRGDEEVRPMFEMIRQNRMPESKSMMGKLLNNLLTTDADRKAGKPREQKVDGSTLPDFEAVRRYFGPHGRVVQSEKDGWFVTGVVLNKESL